MKRTISILFLILLLYNSIGHPLVLSFWQSECKAQIPPSPQLKVMPAPLKIFRLYSPSNNLTSLEIDGDFVIEDEVYSIAKCESRRDTLYIYYKDKVDKGITQLSCGEHAQMQGEHVPSEAPPKQINSQQIKDYLVDQEDFILFPNVPAIRETNTTYCLLFKSFSPKVLIPPPEEV